MDLRRVMLRVRLLRKFAERLNGLDLTHARVGDSIDVSAVEARMLIAEGWAELVDVQEPDEWKKR